MKKLLALIFMVPLALIGEGKDHPIIVTAAWLNEHKADADLVILQVSGLRFEYDNEHIAGARYLWPSWLAPDSPEGAMNAPDAKKATETLQSLGISSDSHVVVCHMRNEVSPAARMFLSLENLGLRGQVSFLNGGLEAWKKEGYPVTKDLPVVKKGNFKPTSRFTDRRQRLCAQDNTVIQRTCGGCACTEILRRRIYRESTRRPHCRCKEHPLPGDDRPESITRLSRPISYNPTLHRSQAKTRNW